MNPHDVKFDGWPHVIESQQFSREWLERVFLPLTDEMQTVFEQGGNNILHGKRMVSLFYQPSWRTRMSSEMAMDYLGGRVVFSSDNARQFSSAAKGESFGDTLKVANRYRPDVIVIRYDGVMSHDFISKVSRVPVISAGDREPGQHPTQALLDLRTIYKRRGSIDGLNIAMVGDLRNGRTVRSLSYLLGKFRGINIYFVSPPALAMKLDVKEYLLRRGVSFSECTDLRDVAREVGVIYQTRTQKECGSSLDRTDPSLGYFTVDRSILDLMDKRAIIMHPLPRNDELATEVDNDPRAVYLTDQIVSGLFTRMALLVMILVPNAI